MKSALRAGVLVATIGVLGSAGSARAARLPNWARSLADTAPEIGPGLPEHPSRVLLDEKVVQVEPDGSLRIRQRVATQALSTRADEIGFGAFQFDDRTEIRRSKAWHLPPEGRAQKSRGAALDIALGDVFLTDQRTRIVHVGGIEKGSLVFFEFEAVERPFHLAFQHSFHAVAPTDLIRLEVSVPDGWSVRHAWLREPGPQALALGNSTRWEMSDVAAREREPLGEAPGDTAPLLVIRCDPPEGIEPDAEVFSDWRAVARWWEELSAGRETPTPAIAEEAEEVFAGTADDPFARIAAAGRFVRDRVRYVAKEIGIAGYRPRSASEVLADLYGDCKDKSTLFRALLASAGMRSYPILVNVSAPDTVSKEIPCLHAFDHFVIGVPLPEGIAVPDRFAAATLDAGDLGTVLVVDTTSELTSIGFLPAALLGKTGLLVAGDRSRLIRMPDDDPSANLVDCRLEAEVKPDLAVELSLTVRRAGAPAASARFRYRDSVADYRDGRERGLLEEWPEGKIRAFEVVDEDETGAFVERVEALVRAPLDPASAERFPMFPEAPEYLERVELSRRETPVLYPYAFTLRFRSTIRGLAEDTAIPEGKERKGDGWTARSSFSGGGGEIHGTWELVVSKLRYGTEELRDLRKMWSAAKATSSRSLDLAGRSD